MAYSTKKVSQKLIEEIRDSLHNVEYGSIEIYVNAGVVTQITKRNIKKTSIHLSEEEEIISSPRPHKSISAYTTKKKIAIKKLSIDN